MPTCINLKERFGADYRIHREEGATIGDPWGLLIPCRYGHIYPWGGDRLAASIDGHTARGRHVYFHSTYRRIKKMADGELRGAGYCLLPPSRHPDGPVYEWLVPLPDGEIPFVADVRAAGLLPSHVTERTERTERTEDNGENGGVQKQLREHLCEKALPPLIALFSLFSL